MDTVSIPIKKCPITLGQFLKMANLVQDGVEAKFIIASGDIFVNDLTETRRGRKLYAGDTVLFNETQYVVSQQY